MNLCLLIRRHAGEPRPRQNLLREGAAAAVASSGPCIFWFKGMRYLVRKNKIPDPHLKSIMRILVRISLALAGSRRRRERATGRGLTFGLLTPGVTISGGISHNFLRLSYFGCQYTSNVRHRRPVTRSRRLGRSLLCDWYHCVRLQPRFDNIHLILDFVQCSSILTCGFFRVLC